MEWDVMICCYCTVDSLHYGHYWDLINCPLADVHNRGFFIKKYGCPKYSKLNSILMHISYP